MMGVEGQGFVAGNFVLSAFFYDVTKENIIELSIYIHHCNPNVVGKNREKIHDKNSIVKSFSSF